MFTVNNRDVKHTVYIYSLSILMILQHTFHVHGAEISPDRHKNLHAENTRDSYENYLPPSRTTRHRAGKPDSKNGAGEDKLRQYGTDDKQANANKKFLRYTILQGDTITRISKKFNVPPDEICSYNTITNFDSIKSGRMIKIPLKKKSAKILLVNRSEEYPHDKNIKPRFNWPLKYVLEYKKDDFNGVKPIGIIIIGKPGSIVLSSAPGVVKKIGQMRGYGNYIVIDHAGRYATVYANLGEISVSEGEKLHAGIIIGKINKYEKKLHFQIDYEGKPENPLKYLPKT
jgi:LysM repeat protein